MLLGKGVVEHRPRGSVDRRGLGLGVSAAGTWFLRTVSTRVQRRFRDKVTIALESHVARLQASIVTIAHQERPEYLDRLSMLRDQVFVLDHMYMSVFSTLRLDPAAGGDGGAAGLDPPRAASCSPCSPCRRCSTSAWRPARRARRAGAGAQADRLARHLFTLATTAPPGKEVRVTGIGDRLIDRSARGVGALVRAGRRGALRSAVWHTLAWAVFGAAYVGAIVFVVVGAARAGRRRAAGARGRRAALGLHRRHGRRDRVPARLLDGRLAPAGVARGLRGSARGRRPICPRPTRSTAASASSTSRSPIPAPTRLVLDDVSLDSARRHGRRHRRRKRRRQDHAGQAARQAVRADLGQHPGRRRRRWRAFRPTSGARGWPAPSRTSSASSSSARHTVGLGDVPRLRRRARRR